LPSTKKNCRKPRGIINLANKSKDARMRTPERRRIVFPQISGSYDCSDNGLSHVRHRLGHINCVPFPRRRATSSYSSTCQQSTRDSPFDRRPYAKPTVTYASIVAPCSIPAQWQQPRWAAAVAALPHPKRVAGFIG
jgi:hypothetical protein